MKKYTIYFRYNRNLYAGDDAKVHERRILFSNHLSGAIRRMFAEFDGVELVGILEK